MSDAETGDAETGVESVFVRIPANSQYIRIARVVAAVLASELGAEIDVLDDVRLAVGEACSLALAAGAETIELQFEVGGDVLRVSGEATPAPVDPEPEQVLTEQILAVTASHYELRRAPDLVSFHLQFRQPQPSRDART